MKTSFQIAAMVLTIGVAATSLVERVWAQGAQRPFANGNAAAALAPAEIDRIIGIMLQKETQNAAAKATYAFVRDESLRTIGMDGKFTGAFSRRSNFNFDARGVRSEKILFFPMTTIDLPPEPVNAVLSIDDFSINTTNIDRYYIQFAGRERIDELGTFVFNVTPKAADDHTFAGRIWVDDRDLAIIKIQGTFGAIAASMRGPVFDIYRESVDGRYWFPTFVSANGWLQVGRQREHIQLVTRYTEYRHRAM